MNCIVTAGPTYEPVDDVRRLTNFSTGRLGSELADSLSSNGHVVTLLRGSYSVFQRTQTAIRVFEFTTSENLLERLASFAKEQVGAIFHAAAVGDFRFGNVWIRQSSGELKKVAAKKIPSRQKGLLVELDPAIKVIGHLRASFPNALIVGWKYGVDGDRAELKRFGRTQILDNRTDACVLNGPAYGEGYGFLKRDGEVEHLPDAPTLFNTLGEWLMIEKTAGSGSV